MLTSVRNRGELAEGWYDPEVKQRADNPSAVLQQDQDAGALGLSPDDQSRQDTRNDEVGDGSDADSIGPSLPRASRRAQGVGPALPMPQDLELQRGEDDVNVMNSWKS